MQEENWADSWKKYFKPIPLGRVTIVPAWEKYEAKENEVVVSIDPGMAFGTGTHETTRLVMKIMQDVIVGGERVLDVGCGSGILSTLKGELFLCRLQHTHICRHANAPSFVFLRPVLCFP